MLTERIVRDASAAATTVILWDREIKGLGLRITPAGARSYVLNYRKAGRSHRATLARAGELPLREVRERAGRELAAIRAGGDGPLARREQARAAPTVNEGIDRFFSEFVPRRQDAGRMSERTAAKYAAQAKRTVRPAIGNFKIAEVTRGDVESAVARLPKVQRNRTLAFVSRLFNLFEHWEYRGQFTNPARGIERGIEEPRDRTLSPAELSAIGSALDRTEAESPAAAAAIRVAALTGLRIGEVLSIRWENVDFEGARVTLPETKTGRRIQALSAPALANHRRSCPGSMTTYSRRAASRRSRTRRCARISPAPPPPQVSRVSSCTTFGVP